MADRRHTNISSVGLALQKLAEIDDLCQAGAEFWGQLGYRSEHATRDAYSVDELFEILEWDYRGPHEASKLAAQVRKYVGSVALVMSYAKDDLIRFTGIQSEATEDDPILFLAAQLKAGGRGSFERRYLFDGLTYEISKRFQQSTVIVFRNESHTQVSLATCQKRTQKLHVELTTIEKIHKVKAVELRRSTQDFPEEFKFLNLAYLVDIQPNLDIQDVFAAWELALESLQSQQRESTLEAQKHFKEGVSAFESRNYLATLMACTRAIGCDPHNYKCYRLRGRAKLKSRDWQAALADFNQTLDINPTSGDTYRLRAIAKAELGLKTEAHNDFDLAMDVAKKRRNRKFANQIEKDRGKHCLQQRL